MKVVNWIKRLGFWGFIFFLKQSLYLAMFRCYRVTPDAEVLVSGRARMTDEEWIAMGRHSSDEDYFTEFAARFPMG